MALGLSTKKQSQNTDWECLPRELFKISKLFATFLCLLFSFIFKAISINY